jgi:hypothetical protein
LPLSTVMPSSVAVQLVKAWAVGLSAVTKTEPCSETWSDRLEGSTDIGWDGGAACPATGAQRHAARQSPGRTHLNIA